MQAWWPVTQELKITSHIHIHWTLPPFNNATKTIHVWNNHWQEKLLNQYIWYCKYTYAWASKRGGTKAHSENLQLEKLENDLQNIDKSLKKELLKYTLLVVDPHCIHIYKQYSLCKQRVWKWLIKGGKCLSLQRNIKRRVFNKDYKK